MRIRGRMALEVRQEEDGVSFPVKVVPGGSRSRIAGLLGGALKVNVAVPPEKGRANEELLRLLTEALHLPRKAAMIAAGATNSRKQVYLAGLTAAQLDRALAPYLK